MSLKERLRSYFEDVDWKSNLYFCFPIIFLSSVLGFLFVSYTQPQYGIKPHNIKRGTVKNIGSEVQARLIHDTTMTKRTNSSQVVELAYNITKDCYKDECRAKEIDDYLLENLDFTIGYSKEYPEPKTVLQRGECRCAGRAIVMASMLEAINIDAYYAYQPRHVCTAYKVGDEMKFSTSCNISEGFDLVAPA